MAAWIVIRYVRGYTLVNAPHFRSILFSKSFFCPPDEDTVEYPMGVRQSATIVFSDNDDDIGDEKGRRKKRRKKGKVSLLFKKYNHCLDN